MKVLWIFAHPEQRSLNGSLMAEGLRTLDALGHEHRVSDLYAMGWKATVDTDDFGGSSRERLFVGAAQERAHTSGALRADIVGEQEKIVWADALVFQFPLWWFGPPAILKGWFDRVLVQGFGFGLAGPDGRTPRYGDGGLAGKRADRHVGRRPGVGLRAARHPRAPGGGAVPAAARDVLVHRHGRAAAVRGLRRGPADGDGPRPRRGGLARTPADAATARPLPYRHENGGAYDADLVLRPGFAPGAVRGRRPPLRAASRARGSRRAG